jgi:hypothetical protein
MKKIGYIIIALCYMLTNSIAFHAAAMDMTPMTMGSEHVMDSMHPVSTSLDHCQGDNTSTHDMSICMSFIEAANDYSSVHITDIEQVHTTPIMYVQNITTNPSISLCVLPYHYTIPPPLIQPYEKGIVILDC